MPPDDAGSDEAIAIEAEVRRFAARELDAGRIEAGGKLGGALLGKLAALGLFGLGLPREHGGLGLALGDIGRVVAALAERDRSVATCVGLHCGLGTRGLVALGSEALRAQWLPSLAAGTRIASFAATEPGAGSNLAAVTTTAVLDGEHLVLTGEKAFVTNGGIAGVFTVLARSPGLGGERGHVLVLVPRETPGVDLGPEERKLGLCASSTVTLRLDGARVPRSHVLGTPGHGLDDAQRVLAWGRTLLAAGCLGTTRAALAAALAYTGMRRQFGRALVEMEPVRAHLAHVAGTVRTLERGLATVARDEQDGISIGATSAALKVLASEGACDAGDRAIQLHGGSGYVEDTGVARLYRDARVTRIFEGSNDVLVSHLGAGLLARAPGLERLLPPCADAEVARRVGALGAALDGARREHGVAVVRRQLLLSHVGRAAVACFGAASVANAPGARDAIDRRAIADALAAADLWLDALARAPSEAAADADVVASLLGDAPHATHDTRRTPQRAAREAAP